MAEDRMLNDEILLGLIKANSGGGGGTNNYENLNNLPKINSVELKGNKSLSDLGIASAQSVSNITNGESINNFAGVETALATKQNATDNNLDTDAKTIVGAINEHEGDIDSLKSGLTNLDNEVNGDATVYPYADVITIPDTVPSNLADCSVKIEPVQDLHGQSAPYVGGAGKNKLPMTVDSIKAANTEGTWSGETYTINGVSYTILTDADGNVTGVKTGNNQTATGGNASFNIVTLSQGVTLDSGSQYIGNGCPANGSTSTYYVRFTGGFDASSDIGEGTGVKTVTTSAISVYIRVTEGATVSDLVFTPMIRLATETDATFAPYTNICPITGHTEASVQRDGKNLFDKDNAGNLNGYALNSETGVPYATASGWTTSSFIEIEPSTTYTLTTMSVNSSVAFYDGEKVYISGATSFGTKTTPSNAKYLRFDYKTENAGIMQLELGSTATPYVPYVEPKTYTIALGDTIYGGTVDFDSGVMTVTHGYADLGNFTYTKQTSEKGTVFFTNFNAVNNAKYGNIDYVGTSLCSCFEYASAKTVSSYNKETINVGYDTSTRLRVCTDAFATLSESDFKTAVTGQTLCYELATPTTIQLTPQQIQLLKGTNTLTASTGQISVTVNGVSGSIGSVQEQVNELAEKIGENQIYSDTPVQIGTVGDKPLYRLFVTFETPISSVDDAYTSTGINSEDIELILRGDGINADGTYYGHLAFDPTFNEHQAIGVKGVANIKYAVIEYI